MIGEQSNLPVLPTEHSTAFSLAGEEEAGGGFTLLQLWHILRAYLWISVGIFVVMLGLAFAVIKSMPKSYQATAALIVNVDDTDPLAGRNQLGLTYTFFPTQLELINNSVVLGPVVDRLKLQADRLFTGGFVGDPKTLKDVVLANLREALQVQQGTGSQFLYISATARDPVQAANIANAVAEEYLLQIGRRTNAPAMERARRYADQVAELKSKVDETQIKVDEFRRLHGMADLKDGLNGGDTEGMALSDLEAKLLQARNERRQLEIRQDTKEAVDLRGKLVQLESDMGVARATMGPQHPRILQLQSQIDDAQKALAGTSASQLGSAREMESKYQAAVKEERNRLLDRRDVQDEGAKLLLEQQLARDAYAQALRGQDQVQFASVGNYKDVTLVSRAEPPVKSAKPNKLKLFLMAIMASFALGVGGPFAYELLLNRRIRCRDDLERHFRIVTLAQFERMNSASAA